MGSTIVRISPRDQPGNAGARFGVAVYEAVSSIIAEPHRLRLKWPNDLMLDGASLRASCSSRSVMRSSSGSGRSRRCTLLIDGQLRLRNWCHARSRHFCAVSRRVFRPGSRTLADLRAPTFGAALGKRCPAFGTPLTVQPPANRIDGTFDGLGADGAPSLRLADGSTRAIHAGDVMLVNQGASKMLLAADVGNANVVFALIDQGEIRPRRIPRSAPDGRRVCRLAATTRRVPGVRQRGHRPGHYRFGGAARDPQSHRPVGKISRHHPADCGAGGFGMGFRTRYRKRCSVRIARSLSRHEK